MSNKVYDFLKGAIIVIPALGVFYVAIAALWNLPYPEAISGTLAAMETLITAIMKISSNKYWKEVNEEDETDSSAF